MSRTVRRFSLTTVVGLLLVASQGFPGERRALLVGCSSYYYLGSSYQLDGPANDVPLVRRALVERFGFSPDNIVVLAQGQGSDHRPTRANIVREFTRLVEEAASGDQI
jgi:hypothetical protein